MGSFGCNTYSSWSFDSAYCMALTAQNGPTSSKQLIGRATPTTQVGSYGVSGGLIWTTTDYDRCLPGPATCELAYSGISCPTPYVQVSQGQENNGKSTAYCCFSGAGGIVVEGWDLPRTTTYTFGSVETQTFTGHHTPVPICVHTGWVDPDHPSIPSDPTSHPSVSLSKISFSMRAILVTNNGLSPVSSPPLSNSPGASTSGPNSSNTSTKISIGVGVSIGVLVLISVPTTIFFLLKRPRRRRHQSNQNIEHDVYGKPELDGKSTAVSELEHQVGQIDGQAVNELETGKEISEMDAQRLGAATELPAEQHPIEMPAGNQSGWKGGT